MITKKINNVEVKAIPLDESKIDKRPIKGVQVCPEMFANILLLAKKKSGKTSIINTLLKHCLGRDTSVLAFVSTLEKDAQWAVIKEYCEKKGKPFLGYTSLFEDGDNMLDAFIKKLQVGEKEEEEKPEAAPLYKFPGRGAEPEPEAKEKKPRKTKYQAPEYIIILDDLSTELKVKTVTELLKKNRHFKAKTIISTQYLNDLPPDGFKQIDILMMFRGFSKIKLQEVFDKAALPMEFEEFIKMYHEATAPQYGFLWLDLHNHTFRKNFTDEFQI